MWNKKVLYQLHERFRSGHVRSDSTLKAPVGEKPGVRHSRLHMEWYRSPASGRLEGRWRT